MSAAAAALVCLAMGVTDGDLITLRCGEQPPMDVRLSQIYVPRGDQHFSKQAEQTLVSLIKDKEVTFLEVGKDRKGRPVGEIRAEGRFINFELVHRGMAWCYSKYVTDRMCRNSEKGAKAQKIGMWASGQAKPKPPSERDAVE